MKSQKPKLIINYEPSDDFDLEFVDFVECVLKFEEEINKKEEQKE